MIVNQFGIICVTNIIKAPYILLNIDVIVFID